MSIAESTERGRTDVVPRSMKVVDFAVVNPKPKPPKVPPAAQPDMMSEAKGGSFWEKWGPVIVVAIVGPVLTVAATLLGESYFRSSDKAAVSSDEHVKQLVQPLIDSANGTIASKLDTTNSRLADLAGKVEHVQGEIDELNARASKLTQDPKRILAAMRAGIETAEKERKVLPTVQLADYRGKLQEFPRNKSASLDSQLQLQYWSTLAAFINYQSFLNQVNHEAPDPSQVSKPCMGLTSGLGGNNVFEGVPISGCVVDLDTTKNVLVGVTFKNCVIRYHGGPVALSSVTFVNCNFILDLSNHPSPKNPSFLLALLESKNQTLVKVG
jgi:hypothetical protein